ncbi:MAG: ZIP family metal transporter [Parcubacteria group bacterium]|nr:ZIP family metal transporter [Parcubacteria group bacterium]
MLLTILIAVFLVSLISFVGVFFLSIKENTTHIVLVFLIAFASGMLLGVSFFELLPEALEKSTNAFSYTIIGILILYVLEKILYWHHCHGEVCEIGSDASRAAQKKTVGWLNIFGDSLHNFIDGAIIALVMMENVSAGIAATIAIALHEIPQEVGDFSVLLYSGFTRKRALVYNFLSALIAVLGALLAYFFAPREALGPLIAVAAGSFIYIACVDLIPELHKRSHFKEGVIAFLFLLAGIGVAWSL